jgi:two-component system, NarL family, nitrate/nitrite response regulator NarL
MLSHVLEGHSIKLIAQHLCVSEATATLHLKRLLRNLNVDNRTQAAIWALSNLPELNAIPRDLVA